MHFQGLLFLINYWPQIFKWIAVIKHLLFNISDSQPTWLKRPPGSFAESPWLRLRDIYSL